VDQVNETRKCYTGRLTVTLAIQGATTPQFPLDGEEEGEPEVLVLVDELCVLADDKGVVAGMRNAIGLIADERTEWFIWTVLLPTNSARLIDAAKCPFAVYRCDETLPGCQRRKTIDAPCAQEASQSMTPPKDENWSRVSMA